MKHVTRTQNISLRKTNATATVLTDKNERACLLILNTDFR